MLPQLVNTQLRKKYDHNFNFFFAKPISEIVFNRTCAPATLDFKDIIVYSQTSQYLKRTYHIKNSAGRNEIFDRIRMLADFYSGSSMLKYEHPMMVISKTKEIFIKRAKRMKKMIASNCSSQQSSSQRSSHSSDFKSFSSSRFLRTINSSQLQDSQKNQDSLIKNCGKAQKSYDSQTYDIFNNSTVDFTQSLKSLQKPQQIQKIRKQIENQVSLQHLIIDLDDVDRQKALKQYKKIEQRQKVIINDSENKPKKQNKMKKSGIYITALDHYSPEQFQSQPSIKNNFLKNMKKNPSIRYKQSYDETLKVNNYHNMGTVSSNFDSRKFNTNQIMRQSSTIRSPSFGNSHPIFQGKQMQKNYIGNRDFKNDIPQYKQISLQRAPTRNTDHKLYEQFNINQSAGYSHPSEDHQNLQYFTQQNSLSSKMDKKQFVREKAVALLHKIKSQQKIPIYNGEGTKSALYFNKQKHKRYQ